MRMPSLLPVKNAWDWSELKLECCKWSGCPVLLTSLTEVCAWAVSAPSSRARAAASAQAPTRHARARRAVRRRGGNGEGEGCAGAARRPALSRPWHSCRRLTASAAPTQGGGVCRPVCERRNTLWRSGALALWRSGALALLIVAIVAAGRCRIVKSLFRPSAGIRPSTSIGHSCGPATLEGQAHVPGQGPATHGSGIALFPPFPQPVCSVNSDMDRSQSVS